MTLENTPQPAAESAGPPPVNHAPSADAAEKEAADRTRQRLRLLPPEVGAVLVTVGVAGLILPGPFGTPFLLAGGLILAPRYFHRMELWAQQRFPDMHRAGRRHVDRFIDDFEKRYPRHPRRESGE
jgi:hypothetical protein